MKRRPVADFHKASFVSQISIGGYFQYAIGNHRPAGIRVGAAQCQRAAAELTDHSRAADRPAERVIIRAKKNQRRVIRHGSNDCSHGSVISDLQRTFADHCSPGIGVLSGQHQFSASALGQPSVGDRPGDIHIAVARYGAHSALQINRVCQRYRTGRHTPQRDVSIDVHGFPRCGMRRLLRQRHIIGKMQHPTRGQLIARKHQAQLSFVHIHIAGQFAPSPQSEPSRSGLADGSVTVGARSTGTISRRHIKCRPLHIDIQGAIAQRQPAAQIQRILRHLNLRIRPQRNASRYSIRISHIRQRTAAGYPAPFQGHRFSGRRNRPLYFERRPGLHRHPRCRAAQSVRLLNPNHAAADHQLPAERIGSCQGQPSNPDFAPSGRPCDRSRTRQRIPGSHRNLRPTDRPHINFPIAVQRESPIHFKRRRFPQVHIFYDGRRDRPEISIRVDLQGTRANNVGARMRIFAAQHDSPRPGFMERFGAADHMSESHRPPGFSSREKHRPEQVDSTVKIRRTAGVQPAHHPIPFAARIHLNWIRERNPRRFQPEPGRIRRIKSACPVPHIDHARRTKRAARLKPQFTLIDIGRTAVIADAPNLHNRSAYHLILIDTEISPVAQIRNRQRSPRAAVHPQNVIVFVDITERQISRQRHKLSIGLQRNAGVKHMMPRGLIFDFGIQIQSVVGKRAAARASILKRQRLHRPPLPVHIARRIVVMIIKQMIRMARISQILPLNIRPRQRPFIRAAPPRLVVIMPPHGRSAVVPIVQ